MEAGVQKIISDNPCWYAMTGNQRTKELLNRYFGHGLPLTKAMESELGNWLTEIQLRGVLTNELHLANGAVYFASFRQGWKSNPITVFRFVRKDENQASCYGESVYEDEGKLFLLPHYKLDYTVPDEPVLAFGLERGEDMLLHYWITECMAKTVNI
ncbi:hypothetical protein C9J03_25895 [Photobacterium gaetbulicola]|uniref:hypothetical protein n=1 Tax=Photobacterium gaetbulicola TaxID=1295392 RepID=UPI0005CBDA03|nr:hypothetical protein [Photobacterium gaetbulicola]PST99178.1 hypothetical protein C9J03_25895 [Photobacterium gaetbulicola]